MAKTSSGSFISKQELHSLSQTVNESMSGDEFMITNHFKHPWTFFIVATIGPWLAWFGAAWLSWQAGSSTLVLFAISLLAGIGMCIPALTARSLIKRDLILLQDLRIRLTLTLRSWRYVLLGLMIMMGSILFAQFISLGLGYSADQFQLAHSASFSAGVLVGWVPLLLAPVIEEIGWHGYGTDALRRSMNLFWGSIIFAIFWALWHIPLAYIKDYYQANLAEAGVLYTLNFLISLIPFVIIMNWLYFRSGRNIWVAVAFHLSANVSNEIFDTNPDSKIIQTIILAVLMLAIVLRDRKMFFELHKMELDIIKKATI